MAGGFQSYSTTPGSNTSINGINIAEGCPPSGVNDALRQLAADGRSLVDGTTIYAGTSGGSANAQTLTASPAVLGLVTGCSFRFIAGFTNTSSATLNVNGLGAQSLVRYGGGALQGGEIVSGAVVTVVLTGSGFVVVPGTPQFRGALINLQAVQSIPNNTFTTVTSWNTSAAVYDTSSFYAVGTPNRFTIPSGVSVVRLYASCSFGLTATGQTAQIRFTKSGSTGVNGCSWATNTVSANVLVSVPTASPPLQVAAADYFQVQVFQNTGGAANLVGSGDQTYFGLEVVQ